MKKIACFLAMLTISMHSYSKDNMENIKSYLDSREHEYIESSGPFIMKSGSHGYIAISKHKELFYTKACIVESSGYTYCMSHQDFNQLTGKK